MTPIPKIKSNSIATTLYRVGIGIGIGVCIFLSGRVNDIQGDANDTLERIELNMNGIKTRVNTMEVNFDNHIYQQGRINIAMKRDIKDLKEYAEECRQN